MPLGAVSDATVLQKGHMVVKVTSGSNAGLDALVGEGARNEEVGDAEGTQNVVDVGAVQRAGGETKKRKRRSIDQSERWMWPRRNFELELTS